MKKFFCILILFFGINALAQEVPSQESPQPRSSSVILQELRDNIQMMGEMISQKDSIIASNITTIEELQQKSIEAAEKLEASIEREAEDKETIIQQNNQLKLQRKQLIILSSILGFFVLLHIGILFLKIKWNIKLPYLLNTLL